MIMNYLLVAAGLFFAGRNILLLTNEQKLRSYLTNQSPGKLWVAKLGEEKTVRLAKILFLPTGILVALALFAVGAWNIYQVHFA